MRHNLFLLRELVKRDVQGRYAGSFLGVLWSFIQPLWLIVLFTFVFSTVLKVSPVGERTSNFAIFLFGGLLPWAAIHEGVLRSSTAITDNASLVKKLRFPSEILVLSVVLAALVQQAIAAAVYVAVLAWVVEDWSPAGMPLLLAALPLQLALTLGLGLLLAVPLQVGLMLGLGLVLSAVHVFFRDTSQILGMVFNVWFYLTPIVYPLKLVPDAYRGWVELNPLTALVGLYRQAFYGGEVAPIPGSAWLTVVTIVVVSAGFWLFRSLKPAFVDEI